MKPENVFLVGNPDNPMVKVIDFGISKVGDAGGTALTRTGMIMGTPSYMAPEQARGDKVDHRADIYAVGGILYRALTGRKPFDSDDPSATLTMVLTEDPERPRSIEPSIPQALELVIQRAMAKKPEDRYSSMAELEADLVPFDPEPTRFTSAPARRTRPWSPAPARRRAEVARRRVLAVPGSQPTRSATHTHLLRATRDATHGSPHDRGSYDCRLLLGSGGFGRRAQRHRAAGSRARLRDIKAEGVLITVGSFAATLTPLILWVRQLARGWGNSVRAVQLADGMRRVIMVSIATSALCALTIRLVDVIVRGAAARSRGRGGAPCCSGLRSGRLFGLPVDQSRAAQEDKARLQTATIAVRIGEQVEEPRRERRRQRALDVLRALLCERLVGHRHRLGQRDAVERLFDFRDGRGLHRELAQCRARRAAPPPADRTPSRRRPTGAA